MFQCAFQLGRCQCDQIGRFLKVFVDKFSYKKVQMFRDHFGFLKTIDFEVITAVATFWQLIEIFRLLFIPTSGHTGRAAERPKIMTGI